MAEDVRKLWDTYYTLTLEMKKFIERDNVDWFMEIAAQRSVIFTKMMAADDGSLHDTDEYRDFLRKLKPADEEVIMKSRSWLVKSRRRTSNVRAYARQMNVSGHMLNKKS